MVDDVHHSGRLENWTDLGGFIYTSAASWAYRGLAGTHRRGILFLRSSPRYWLMVDRISGDEKPHDYLWLGHFQRTKLTVDPNSKYTPIPGILACHPWESDGAPHPGAW